MSIRLALNNADTVVVVFTGKHANGFREMNTHYMEVSFEEDSGDVMDEIADELDKYFNQDREDSKKIYFKA